MTMTKLQNKLDQLSHYQAATFSPNRVKLLASSHLLPGTAISNEQLITHLSQQVSSRLARKAKIISKKLGIENRYLSRSLQQRFSQATPNSPDLGVKVIQQALSKAQLEHDQLAYLIGHTTSPHTLLPPNISWVAEQLEHQNPYLELRQACTGFANALQIASAMLSNQSSLPIAIMGSEVGSVYFDLSKQFIDTQQLVNFMQMGDGAGAVILASDNGDNHNMLSDLYIGHIGNHKSPGFMIPQGGADHVHCQQGLPYFQHQVSDVRAQGEQLFLMGIKAILSRGYNLDEFKYIIPHQVNGHLDKLLSKELGISPKKIIVDAKQLGNLGSAAIWVSLDRLRASGLLSSGDKVLVLGAEATKYMYGGFIYHH